MKKINMVLFLILALFLTCFQFLLDSSYLNIFSKPWHMQSFAHEDSLSAGVMDQYQILDKKRVYPHFVDSTETVVSILVDAWGVSMNDSLLKQEFTLFEKKSHLFAVHHRQLNQTLHAEKVELRNSYDNSIYLFGGDSLEYKRNEYIPRIGFSQTLFCPQSSDKIMLGKIDSLLSIRDSLSQPSFISFTTQSSRGGNLDSLHASLKEIVRLVDKHPETTFIVQGTHRPILGSPETRRLYYAHWVPVVVANKNGVEND